MNKRRDFFVKLALLCAGYGMFSDAVVVPLITSIFTEYPDTSTFLMNFIISGPALIAIPVSLLAGELARIISKKDLLIIAFVFYLVGGVGGAFTQSMLFLGVMRGLCGAAAGLIGVLAYALIGELYSDIKERSNVMGWYGAMSAVFGIAMTFLAGIIAVVSWRNAFFINAFSLFSLLLVIFFLPRTPAEGKSEHCDKEIPCEPYPIKKMILLLSAFFVIGALYCVLYYCVDIYVVEKALGNSVLSGLLTAIGTIASFIVGVLFGKIYIHTRRFMPVIFFLACGIGFLALAFTQNGFIVASAAAIAGGAYGMSVSYYAMVITELVPESKMSLSMAFYQVVFNVSIFLAPYVPIIIGILTKNNSLSGSFVFIGGILTVGGLISLVLALGAKKAKGSFSK